MHTLYKSQDNIILCTQSSAATTVPPMQPWRCKYLQRDREALGPWPCPLCISVLTTEEGIHYITLTNSAVYVLFLHVWEIWGSILRHSPFPNFLWFVHIHTNLNTGWHLNWYNQALGNWSANDSTLTVRVGFSKEPKAIRHSNPTEVQWEDNF